MYKKFLGRGMVAVAMIIAAVMTPSLQAYAAVSGIWAGEQITVTFTLPPLTNLNWTPALGNTGAQVEEIANIGHGMTNGLATISSVDLIQASTNTFVATFTVPAPEYGTLWSDVSFALNLPNQNDPSLGYVSGGDSTGTYNYITPPPVGQLPEVPYAAAFPVIGLLTYGVVRWRRRDCSQT